MDPGAPVGPASTNDRTGTQTYRNSLRTVTPFHVRVSRQREDPSISMTNQYQQQSNLYVQTDTGPYVAQVADAPHAAAMQQAGPQYKEYLRLAEEEAKNFDALRQQLAFQNQLAAARHVALEEAQAVGKMLLMSVFARRKSRLTSCMTNVSEIFVRLLISRPDKHMLLLTRRKLWQKFRVGTSLMR